MRTEGLRKLEILKLEEVPAPGTILISQVSSNELENEIAMRGFGYSSSRRISRSLPNFQKNDGLLVIDNETKDDMTIVNVLHNGSVFPIQWHGKLRVLMSHGFIRVLDGVPEE